MKALKCDDCGVYFDEIPYRGAYYLIREGVGSFAEIHINLELCNKCWDEMIKKIMKDLKAGGER